MGAERSEEDRKLISAAEKDIYFNCDRKAEKLSDSQKEKLQKLNANRREVSAKIRDNPTLSPQEKKLQISRLHDETNAHLADLPLGWSPYRLPARQVVVWAVTQAQGKIDNGGFEYFFENDWPEKPPYKLFIGAFRQVGALEGGECMEKAVAEFPFADSHKDFQKRRDHMKSCQARDGKYETPLAKLGNRMMDLSEENYAKVAAYIRKHLDDFRSAKAFLSGSRA